MGFASGSVSFTRFKVVGVQPTQFGIDEFEKLSAAGLDENRVATEGPQVGWIAGDHIFDYRFDPAKNIVADTLQFAIRIDTQKAPADLLRAYYKAELDALVKENPSGLPSTQQKKEARESAKHRLEQESKDGRFIRRKATPILWDSISNEVLVATTSAAVLDRVLTLFKSTFGGTLEAIDSTMRASVGDSQLTPAFQEVGWVTAADDFNFLGNEFLIWLWWLTENVSDTVRLKDSSEVAVMFSKSLAMQCPKGQYGKESFTSDGPAKLPEALRALKAGRMPRKAGLTLHRHDNLYTLGLSAETLSVASAKLPKSDEENDRAQKEDRVNKLRHLIETLDLLYDAFLAHRLDEAQWADDMKAMKEWIK